MTSITVHQRNAVPVASIRTLVALGVLLFGVACQVDSPLECREACSEASQRVYDAWLHVRACESDDDCVEVTDNDVRCAGSTTVFGQCPDAVARDQLHVYRESLENVAEDVCPRVEQPCGGCSASCLGGTPRCVDSQCDLVRGEDLDGGSL